MLQEQQSWILLKTVASETLPGSRLEARIISDDSLVDVEKLLRYFKISKHVLDKYGLPEDCPGCEGTITGKRRRHTTSCRKRLETEMLKDEGEKRNIESRNERMPGERCVVEAGEKEEVVNQNKEEGEGDREVEVDKSDEAIEGIDNSLPELFEEDLANDVDGDEKNCAEDNAYPPEAAHEQ